MIITYQDFIREVHNAITQSTRVDIATFNIHVGISAAGGVYTPIESHKMVNEIAKLRGSRILVGLPRFGIRDCQKRVGNCAEYWRGIEFRTKTESHLKCLIFHLKSGETRGMIGGRNLGDSEWADVMVWLDRVNSKRLLAFFESTWTSAKLTKPSKHLKLISRGAVIG